MESRRLLQLPAPLVHKLWGQQGFMNVQPPHSMATLPGPPATHSTHTSHTLTCSVRKDQMYSWKLLHWGALS